MANNAIAYSSTKSPQHPQLSSIGQGLEPGRHKNAHFSSFKLKFSGNGFWMHGKIRNFISSSRGSSVTCSSTETRNSETRECSRQFGDHSDVCSGSQVEDEHPVGQGISEACKYVCNDAKYMNERARKDIVLLSRGIMRLDARARQDVAILGTEFLKLDARAREDTEKIDNDVKRKAEKLHHVATILKNKAQSRLKSAADKHWSDGALEADLRRADFAAKQRAMEDALMALEFVKNIHDRMVSKMYKFPLHRNTGSLNINDMKGHITLEKNGTTLNFLPGEVSPDRIAAIKEAYLDIAAALSEADGIDYTDPEELELLVATLIDLDAMDGKRSALLLAECSTSPDENTRKALANALSSASSIWTLGNAGMGALQRLAEDSNPAIAAAASRTIQELKRQWEIKDGDSWRFMVNQMPMEDRYNEEDED
ncbi:hypothetical protein M9H77_34076 [Catharanthus roseus]|uniref:Uncharacterized protein n=1 Tax=Catharanthus roseus TaxID=4058 RepID=A0ACB9ZML7_CATRO|nr:hypothetical protein M9H77_34076 [Catharanthus roseus]